MYVHSSFAIVSSALVFGIATSVFKIEHDNPWEIIKEGVAPSACLFFVSAIVHTTISDKTYFCHMRKSANSEDAPQQTPRNTVSLDGMDNHDGDCESNVIIEHRKTWIALIKFGCHMDRKHTK